MTVYADVFVVQHNRNVYGQSEDHTTHRLIHSPGSHAGALFHCISPAQTWWNLQRIQGFII